MTQLTKVSGSYVLINAGRNVGLKAGKKFFIYSTQLFIKT